MIRINAARFAAAYGAMNAAHDLADHVIQTDWQAGHKADENPLTADWAMRNHVMGQVLTQGAALGLIRLLGVELAPGGVLGALALQGLSHAFWDRRWPVTRLLEATGSERFARAPLVGHGSISVLTETPAQADERAVASRRMGGVEHLEGYTVAWADAVPLHGPYLADQALHHWCTFLAALVASLEWS